MNLTALAIENRVVTYFFAFLLVVGGIGSFFQLGQLEDPDFTVKTAVVVTEYPGASPTEVELEVTDRIERAIQELPQLDSLYSESRAGQSIITVDIKQEYWADRLPQVWDELRKKVRDVRPLLPPGADEPDVVDDFSFVYGFVLAVTGEGYSQEELYEYVKALRKDLSLVPGVARAELWGEPVKVVYVDVPQARFADTGLSEANLMMTLQQQNAVVDAGWLESERLRLRVSPTGSFESPEDIGELEIRGTTLEALATATLAPGTSSGGFSELERLQQIVAGTDSVTRIADIATVQASTLQPPPREMRWNDQPAIGISLANVAGGNVVLTGRALDRRLDELIQDLPLGIEVHKVAWQSDLVTSSINDFLVNLLQAIAIVMVVLTLPMGLRMGAIVGTALITTILGTFILMAAFEIDLQRMSLGALVIALGMMVDNAIVVADGIYAGIQRGRDAREVAVETARRSSGPLLGATLVAVMAFYPIFASEADAGEYCRALFTVVATALLLSWLIALTITPVQCLDMLRAEGADSGQDPYGGALFQRFRALLEWALRKRVLFLASLAGLLALSIAGSGGVRQMFFPDSSRAQLMIDYWAPQETRIQTVSESLRAIEARLLETEHVTGVASFVGMGPPRFYLPVDPEVINPNYGQIVVNLADYRDIPALIEEMTPWAEVNVLDALLRVRAYGVGPSDTWKFEARFHGPANADLETLRRLGAQGLAILEDHPMVQEARVDMRERVRRVVPRFAQTRARLASVTREDVGVSTKRSFDGARVGIYRERDDLFPIFLRDAESERAATFSRLDSLQVASHISTTSVPLEQVTHSIDFEWEDPIVIRHERRRAITVQATPKGVTFPTLREAVLADFEAIELPPGYELYWDGEYESTVDAQASLIPGIVPAGVVIVFLVVALFNSLRQPLIILSAIPFVVIGIVPGLILTGAPFGFVALLGAMSLAGMMIKNAIVLLDQIDAEVAGGKAPYDAIVDSAIARLRPVLLAAGTTVLGVIPLLGDVFWFSMAITIMAGLSFGTILTMVLVPVGYAVLFRVPSPTDRG